MTDFYSKVIKRGKARGGGGAWNGTREHEEASWRRELVHPRPRSGVSARAAALHCIPNLTPT